MGNLEQAAEKKPLIVLTGPTAVGKTALSIQLARRIGGEIISADSMQVYRHMDIGTAKIRLEEMDGVPHHLIDILEPTEDFNVVRFQALARAAAEDIYSRGKIPIVAGGTGFYIQALLNDIDFTQIDENTQFREEMERLAAEQGAEVLHERLRAVDPESAEAIHANNVKRVRADSIMATQPSPGMPSVSRGMRVAPQTALLADSAAATPSTEPWPNSSGCLDIFFAVL